MFDLEIAIATWRQRLTVAGLHADTSLDELESHLRQSIDALQDKKLSQEESYLVALRRLGEPSVLCEEFAKVNAPWADRLLWMLVGVLSFEVAIATAGFMRDLAMVGIAFTGLHGWPVTLLAVIGVIAGYAVAVSLCLLTWRSVRVTPTRHSPIAWAIGSTVLVVASKFSSAFVWTIVAKLQPRDLVNYSYGFSMPVLAVTLLIPIAICVAIVKLRRRTAMS